MAQRTGIDLSAQSLRDCDLTALSRSHRDQLSIERLVILVPARGTNMSALARRVWALAEPCSIPVLYVGLAGHETAAEGNLRLRMITLASMTRDEKVQVESHFEPGNNWIQAIHKVWKPGDVIICLAEHEVHVQYRGNHMLSEVIEAILDIPVYVVPGVMVRQRDRRREVDQKMSRLADVVSRLALPLLFIGALFVLQVRISFGEPGIMRTLLLSITGLAEVGVLGIWSLSRR